MKVLNSLKSLGVSLEDLYNPDVKKQIVIHLSDKSHDYNVILTNFLDKPDCKLSSFFGNFWTRTNKGINYEKYKTLGTLQAAIVNEVKRKINTNGDISFSITEDSRLI